jgi:two-component system OmpR family sensor kinase
VKGAGLRPRRMFWRIYAFGLLMLVGAAVAFSAAVRFLEPQEPVVPDMMETTRHLAQVAHANPAGLPHAFEPLARKGFRATVYGPWGERIASSAEPPLAPLDAREQRKLRTETTFLDRGGSLPQMAAPVWNADSFAGYVVIARTQPGGFPYLTFGGALAFVMLVLAGLSLPAARVLSSPLERLTAVVREFGQGRLSARAGLEGHDEVAELGRTFDEMAGRMESLIRGQKELLANVSHELRTPLARLGVTLDLVEEGQPDELARRLPELRRDISELQELVDGVLQTAKLDLATNQAGQPGLGLQRRTVKLDDLLRDAAERFQRIHPECPFHLELPAELPVLRADPVLLRRAVHNLLDNARKYSEPGSPVTLRARADAQTVELEVEDRGIGISPEDLPLIATPFFRTDRSRTRGTGGVGLGLTLVVRIAEAHGGTLFIQGVPKGGTRMVISLPR